MASTPHHQSSPPSSADEPGGRYARSATTLLYRERRLFTLVVLMIAALGALASTTIGRQEDPTITNLFASVLTPYPGADPKRVEALVTEVIEAELDTIPEIKRTTSVSRTGFSAIQIALSEFVPDSRLEQLWSEIRDAIADAAVRLPEGAGDPEFSTDRSATAFTAIFALERRHGGDASLPLMSRYADHLADLLRRSPGTEYVEVYGEAEEEVLVEIDPLKLSYLGLTPDAVSRAIAAADAKVRAGRVRGSEADYLLEVEGEIRDLARLRAIPIVSQQGRDRAVGAPIVRLGDVASIRRSERTPPREIAIAEGERAVLVAARMTPDRQVDVWMRRRLTPRG